MDNAELTKIIIEQGKQLTAIEAHTKFLPEFQNNCYARGIQVHDNTQHRIIMEKKIPDIDDNTKFRKNYVKVLWISGGAALTSIVALIFAMIGVANKGG